MTASPALDVVVHDGRGPYALFVHGILSSRATWMRNLPGLARHCRPVTVNLWGHAGAPTPEDPRAYQPGAYAEAFEALRRSLNGADRWIVVGQSMGAGLTLRYSLEYPERVMASVATNSMSAFADDEDAARLQTLTARAVEAMNAAGPASIQNHAWHPARSTRLDPEQRAAVQADWDRHDHVGVMRTMRDTVPALPVRARLRELSMPAMLVNGTREAEFQPVAIALRAELPLWRHVDLDGAHMINQHDPAGFVTAVAAFLRPLFLG